MSLMFALIKKERERVKKRKRRRGREGERKKEKQLCSCDPSVSVLVFFTYIKSYASHSQKKCQQMINRFEEGRIKGTKFK